MSWRLGVALALVVAGCTQPAASNRANLVGTQDLVLVDELGTDDRLAGTVPNDQGTLSTRGMPARYLFLTSADTGELRILENYREVSAGRGFMKAPNPLESLSIPVLDRPTMLAVDEGRNAAGARVTGAYVYATRPGASELSVVSIKTRRQLGGRPMVTPGPLTALAAFMAVDATKPVLDTPLPQTTRVFISTWDGATANLYAATLPTDSREMSSLDFEHLASLGGEPVVALMAVAPDAERKVDGASFCAAEVCLAVAQRAHSGTAGETFIWEPATRRSLPLDFGGPIKEFASAAESSRLYGVLDEQACGGAPCGGVMAVDLTTGTSAQGFLRSLDALGLPWEPVRWGQGLLTGLTVASGGALRLPLETLNSDGTTGLTYVMQGYSELGAFASSTGTITFFSGRGGGIIDFDPRRGTVVSASTHVPTTLEDGGVAFVSEDGGSLDLSADAGVAIDVDLDKTWRVATVTDVDGHVWSVDISDGYLDSQTLLVVNQGLLAGLNQLPTSPADGQRLTFAAGLEGRVAVGDKVLFDEGSADTGYQTCGRTSVTAVGAGFLELAEVPQDCEGRSRFSVRAAGAKPLVVVAGIEGFLGRLGWGESLSYQRRHILLPAAATAPRAALTLTAPASGFDKEGAYLSIDIVGHLTPYQVALDMAGTNTGIGCYSQLPNQVVLGNLVMAPVPTSLLARGTPEFRWTTFVTVPSGNGVAEISQILARVGSLGLGDGANCWR